VNAFDQPQDGDDPVAPTKPRPLVIKSAVDLVAAVPYLLGYMPADSLVIIGYGGPHVTCALRGDLPDTEPDRIAAASHSASVLARNEFPNALLIGYGPAADVDPMMSTAFEILAQAGITVADAVRVYQGRWFSCTCPDPNCCPPEGTPFDISTTVVAAQATFDGHLVLADRAALVHSVAPPTGKAEEAARQAAERAEQRFLHQVAESADSRANLTRLLGEGIDFIETLLRRARTQDQAPPTEDEIAWLGVLLTSRRLRDEAWVRTRGDHPHADIAFWRDVLRRVAPSYAAAPAFLLAYAAYITGDGALANVALERAHTADPSYSAATLLHQIIQAGIPPSEITLLVTPEELAAQYGDRQIPPPPTPGTDPESTTPRDDDDRG
jgi:hypothetical protein